VYAKVFQVMQFPHVSIFDPFSGLVMWRKEGWSAEKPLTAAAFSEAFLALPNIDVRKYTPSDHSVTNASDNNSNSGRSSSLYSLLQSWERLSVGDVDDSGFDMMEDEASAADASSWTNVTTVTLSAQQQQQPIPLEIVTESFEDFHEEQRAQSSESFSSLP
jgi:hypothetical protein